jgi:hypothetical protein
MNVVAEVEGQPQYRVEGGRGRTIKEKADCISIGFFIQNPIQRIFPEF